MKTSSIKNSKKLPKFITSHKIFTKFKTIEKVFPEFGLKNCSIRVNKIINSATIAEAYRINLIKRFSQVTSNYYTYGISNNASVIVTLLKKCKGSDFIINGTLSVPKSLKGHVPTTFSSAYCKCRFGAYDTDYYERRGYGNVAKPLNLTSKAKVVFSSDGRQGMWDIATMSMRGISSCQSWNGSYKRNLVGSMIDPCVGIIYIQDGAPCTKGSRMKRRALVRYVLNKTTRKPALLIERIYPSNEYNEYGSNEQEALAIFTTFLEKVTKGRIPIVTSANGYAIPNSKIVQKMSSCGKFDTGKDHCRSYRDSGIAYSKSTALFLNKIVA